MAELNPMSASTAGSVWCEDIASCLIGFLEFEDLIRLRIINRDFQNSVDTYRAPFRIFIGSATSLVEASMSRDNILTERTRKILSKATLFIDNYTQGVPKEESLPYFHSIVWLLDWVDIPREFFDAFLDQKYEVRCRDPSTINRRSMFDFTWQFVQVFKNAHSIEGMYVETKDALRHYAPFYNKCQWVKVSINGLSAEDCLFIAEGKKMQTEPVKWIVRWASQVDQDCDLNDFDEIESLQLFANRIDVSRLLNVKSVGVKISANRDEFVLLRRAHQSWSCSVEHLSLVIVNHTSWDSFLRNIDILDNLSNCRKISIDITCKMQSLDLNPLFERMGDRLRNLTVLHFPRRHKITVDLPQQVSLNRLCLSGQLDSESPVIFTSECLDIHLRKRFRFPNCKQLRLVGYRESGLHALLDNWPSGLKLLIILPSMFQALKDFISSAIDEGRIPSGCKIGLQHDLHNPHYSIIYEEGEIDLLEEMESDQESEECEYADYMDDISDYSSSDVSL